MGNTGLKMFEDALAADSELRDKYQEILDRVIAEGGAKDDGEVIQKVAAEVANVLKSIKEEVGTLSRAVKSAQGRLAQNQADAPEG